MSTRSTLLNIVVCLGLSTPLVFGQTIELAKDYYEHNLDDKAKDILITMLHSQTALPASKAKALYLLGQISFDEHHFSIALRDWDSLIKAYAESPEAKEVSSRLVQLKETVTKGSDRSLNSAIATSYISHGDFWSKAGNTFLIDSSFLEEEDLAIPWYDRVIKEFPGSDAAELAYQRKLFVLVGWKDPDGTGHGVQRLPRIVDSDGTGLEGDTYSQMPRLLETFASFEKAFPTSSYLQGFRYQIAQAYWRVKDWSNTRLWLQKVVDEGKGARTFYTETARARLQKIEH